jgi:signal transduction histidine kinase/ligand-binding sensor domain-containing protein
MLVAGIFGFASTLIRADSPPYLIDLWTPYEGLPQSRVLSIAQTPDGFLWVSTQLGWLARFDGIDFDHFNPTNTPALVSPEIQKLMVDDKGVLWAADIDGLLLSYSNGNFTNWTGEKPGYPKRVVNWLGSHGGEQRFVTASGMLLRLGKQPKYENEDPLLASGLSGILGFCQDKRGTLWRRTPDGKLGKWVNGAFQPLNPGELPEDLKVNHMLAAPDGGLWIATTHGLWKHENGVISRRIPGLAEEHSNITQLAQNPDGCLWLRTSDSVVLCQDEAVVRIIPLTGIAATPLLKAIEMHADSNGGAWILKLGGGVWHVDRSGELTTLSTANGLPSNLVETWFEDREKNIWLGTAAGLVRVRPRWFHAVDAIPGGAGIGVVSISQDPGGDIWFGRANGLSRLRDGVPENVPLASFRSGFPIADITIAPGAFPGEVWLGTVQSGAMLLRDGEIMHPFPFHAPGLAIRVIRRDPEGGIWLGGEFGLFRWDGKSLRKFGPKDGLTPGHIHDVSFDHDGTPWIAKADDLLMVFRDGRFTPIPLPGVSSRLRVYSVLCGVDDNIWLGTVGGGLLHLARGKLFQYTTEDGLPSDSVTQLIEDDDGHLWGGTLQGIFRVSTTALDMHSKGVRTPVLFQNYGHSDGLPTAECSGGLQPACWKASDGRLWFSTSASAVVVDPRKVTKSLAPPIVAIEQMRVNGSMVPITSDNEGRSPHDVPPGRHRYEFLFTGLSFNSPEKINFQWRLDGVDEDWIDGGNQRAVSYSGLDPGPYQFSVRARNHDGVWSLEPATVAFHVNPSLWQRTSVKAGMAVTGSAFAYLLITGLMRRKHARELRFLEYERSLEQQRFRHKAAMEAERARIAAELHDDLGANLTQIQWLGDSVIPSEDSSSGDKELLLRISRKSREMVRLIDQIVWAVNPKNDTLEQLVTYICNFAEQYFRDSATRCRIDVADDIPAIPLKADVRHHLFLIAKEALHNTAKHAATDRVWLRMTCRDGLFRLVIEDHGQGFDAASASGGNGLANMKHRAQQAGAALDIDSSPGNGTRITLTFETSTQPA